jgi:hypothetical protein
MATPPFREISLCPVRSPGNSTPAGSINAVPGTILHAFYDVNIISSGMMVMQGGHPAAGGHQEKEVIFRDGAEKKS